MAKRSRGAARPGQLRPSTRRPQQQRPAARAGGAPTDVARTARPAVDEVTAEPGVQVDQRPVTRTAADRPVEREKNIVARGRPNAQPSSLIAQRAAQEYGYVARDVRHIGVVGGGLLLVLIALFVINQVAHFV